MIDYDRMGEAELTALNATGYVAAQPRQRAAEIGRATRERRRAKDCHPPEREVQKSGIAILKAMGWRVYRRNVGGMKDKNGQYIRFGESGMSDTWGITPDGRHFELEFKKFGEKPNAKQLAWLKSMNGKHHVAFWVDSTEWLEKAAIRIGDGCIVLWCDGCQYVTQRP